MKKLIALLLSALMLLSLAACGKTEPDTDTQKETQQAPQTDTQPALEGKTLTTDLWSLTYDDQLWTYDEEDLDDYDDYAAVELIIPDKDNEGEYITSVEIKVSVDNHKSFRSYLESFEFDAYKYAEENAYETVKVGGIDCLKKETESWGEARLVYFGRGEAASVTLYIDIYGEVTGENVDTLLAGLAVTAEDIGSTDAPWPWNGEPFSSSGGSESVGGFTVTSQWLPLSECIVTSETFDHAVAESGGKVYILGEETLRQYVFDGEKLTYEKDVPISGDYKNIQKASDGTLWVSGFMLPMISLKDGQQTGSFEDPEYVTMHPSGTWGISYFSGPECEKVTPSGSTLETSKMNFKEVSTISTLHIDKDYIYVCGYAEDDSGHKVFVYDHSGTLKMTLTGEGGEALGSITYIAQTANGFLGLDGNMRDIVLWTKDGAYIGSAEDSDLFGTDYPWFCSGTKLDDGSILVIMTDDRADESATELVVFKLSVQ